MLKVLIVDDDSIARTNIKTMMDWNKSGFDICGEAANGVNAIQLVESSGPDIVITDMSMPVMDGVALIEYLEKHSPRTKVIALSGYDDFEYVRQSMKKGAVDYLLKHKLNGALLQSVLETAAQRIREERKIVAYNNLVKEQLTESRAVLSQNFIKQLVQGTITEKKEIEWQIKNLELRLDTRNLSVVICKIDDFHFLQERYTAKEIYKLISSFEDIACEILRDAGKALITYLSEGKFVIIFSYGNMRSDLYIYNSIMTAVDRVKTSIRRFLNITACFSLGGIFNDITEISKYYNETDVALQDKFFRGKDKVIKENENTGKCMEFLNLDINDEKKLIHGLKNLDRTGVREQFDHIFEKLSKGCASYKSIRMICAELINIINRVAKELGIDAKLIYSDDEIPYDEMKKYETLTEVKAWISGAYERLIGIIAVARIHPGYSEPTAKAIEFILRNYFNPISLNEAADFIGVNSSYLSRVFKRDCGIGFVEYLNRIRVEYAKQSIQKGNTKLKEVVKEVGFNNYTYFFKVFKDSEGMTPQEYEGICRTAAFPSAP